MEDQQDLLDQITSCNAKLTLLQQAKAIEDAEQHRAQQNTNRRNERANEIRSRNMNLSALTHNDAMFQREEAERRELVKKMKKDAMDLGLQPIVNILDNFEGII